MGTEDKAVLGTAAHRLGIDIVFGFAVLAEPAFLFPGLEIRYGLVIGALLVLAGNGAEVNLRLGDMQQGFLPGHRAGFLGVQDIIRGCGDLGHQIFGRTDCREGFYSDHNYQWLEIILLQAPVAR